MSHQTARSRLVQPPMLNLNVHQQLPRANNTRLLDCLTATVLPPIPISAKTPAFPSQGRKGHRNHIHSYYDSSRKLQIILKFKPLLFPGMVAEYLQAYLSLQLPEYYYNSHQAVMYTPPLTNVPLPREITTVAHTAEYVYNWSLLPIQRVFHTVTSSETNYAWSPIAESLQVDNNPDQDLLRVYQWRAHDKKSKGQSPKMLAFVQPPWVLGERDFANFVKTRSMPQFSVNEDGEPTQLTAKERLWAKIYDECTRNNCRWFVVTTYYHWAFGVFSEGFSAATITQEMPSPRPGPSISPLQALYYWLCSSMQHPGSFIPDKFMETPYRSTPSPVLPKNVTKYDVFQASASESSSEEEDENITTYSRVPHKPSSELSFQSTTIDSTPGLLKNIQTPLQPYRSSAKGGTVVDNSKSNLPLSGDRLTKEAVLPRRHWGSSFKADCVLRNREELKRNQTMNETLDWLDEGLMDGWPVGGYATARSPITTTDYSEVGFGREPPSPTESSSDGSVMGTKVGQVLGKAMFAVAPKHPRRHYDV